jgi:DNA (cytosine-5)-methyltransferase 1
MRRDDFTLTLDLRDELIIDNFAGGGGTSTGLEAAFGRPVDIAINHDPKALAMHALNHPKTLHLLESVWTVDPRKVTKNQPVALVWLSPDCKHFSKAKGGTPVAKHIRGLAWVALRWEALTKPRVIVLENVEEFQDWGPLIFGSDGHPRPDPARKGITFKSFIRQLRARGYDVDYRVLHACDTEAPTIRKRLFIVARRDGLPIVWPDATNGSPSSAAVIAGKLFPWRTAAECIDFHLPAASVFDRKRPLVPNTMRRVAKGIWRHVLSSPKPFIVGVGGRMGQSAERSVYAPMQTVTSKADSCIAEPILAPFIGEHSNASNQRNMPADEPLRTICAQVKGGHFSVIAPTLASLRGTSPAHLGAHQADAPLSTISAGGTHHALVGANLITIGYGERPGQAARSSEVEAPLGTVVAANKHALVAGHLVDMGHGESSAGGAKRWSHGNRSLDQPLNTVTASGATSAYVAAHLTHLTHHGDRSGNDIGEPMRTVTGAHRGEQALVAACLEQANGGFYVGDGRPVDAPMSTICSAGSTQRLITAYCVKYYSNGGQWQALHDPMHTLPTKGRMGLVQVVQVPAESLAPELRERARRCAELLHEHLPEHFPERADMVLIGPWALVDITLRMLKPRELYRAQSFPESYIIHEIPDPAMLFKDGAQVADPLSVPRIPLTGTDQVRMCGNSVAPKQAEALIRANFAHELNIPRRIAA